MLFFAIVLLLLLFLLQFVMCFFHDVWTIPLTMIWKEDKESTNKHVL